MFDPTRASKRWRPTLRIADTTYVGWKTDLVRDDGENGLGPAVACKDGLAARRPRAKDGPLACKISAAHVPADLA
jgi:hypothetical protein